MTELVQPIIHRSEEPNRLAEVHQRILRESNHQFRVMFLRPVYKGHFYQHPNGATLPKQIVWWVSCRKCGNSLIYLPVKDALVCPRSKDGTNTHIQRHTLHEQT